MLDDVQQGGYDESESMRLLCVSDIQGNLAALQAVLAMAERVNFQKLLAAGDLLFPGPEPLETWRRLSAAGAVMVQGATERALATLSPDTLRGAATSHEKALSERFAEVQKELGDVVLERIRRLPAQERIPLEDGRELLLVHGSPSDPLEAMSHDLDDEELLALVGDDPADIIVCGMSHVPFDRIVGEVRIINVGSVGDAPDGRSEGDPIPRFAHATWIDTSKEGIEVEQFIVRLAADPAT